jgi:hypothetical protein
MKGLRRRVTAAVVVAASVSGLSVGGVPTAQAAEGIQQFDLRAEVRCRGELPGEEIDFTGTVRTAGVAPRQVDVAEEFSIIGELTLEFDTDLGIRPEDVYYRAQTRRQQYVPRDGALDMRFRAAFDPGALTFGYERGVMLVVWASRPSVGEAQVFCEATQGGDSSIVIDTVMPADGSLQRFDLAAVATCWLSSGRFVQEPFRLQGVASARVAPGQRPRIVADYEGFAQAQQDSVSLSVTGDGGWRSASFTATSYGDSARFTPPQAGPAGSVDFRFWQVTTWYSAKFEPYVGVWCTFPATTPVLRIPVTS